MVPALHWRPDSQSSSIWQTSPSPCLQDQNATASSAVPRIVPSRNFADLIRGVNSTGVSPLTSDPATGLPEVACRLLLRVQMTVGGETFFEELKRYVRFGRDEEVALRHLAPQARPYFREIAEAFYERLAGHDGARRVFTGPEQIERLKGTMVIWLERLLAGPWDEEYYQRRARIGRRHVQIELPQRYMFGAMDHIRIALSRIANL